MVNTHKLVIRSTDRRSDSASTSDFTVQLPYDMHIKAATLLSTHIPELYNVDSSNSAIEFIENVGLSAIATIPPGAYNAINILPEIDAAMALASPNARTYTSSYSTTTNRITIVVSAATFALLSGTANRPLGFAPTIQAISHTGTSIAGLDRQHQLMLLVDEFGLHVASTNLNDRGTFLVDLAVDVNQTNNVLFKYEQYKQRIVFGTPKRISSLHVSLFQSRGAAVDLAGQDWIFTLEVELVCGLICNCKN